MNTQNVNVRTAAQESSRKMGDELTVDQFTDLFCWVLGNDSNLLIVFYVQIMPDDFVMQLHRF
ncbi:Uncharacterised protein [Kluyvera ascorbata]|nr:hypothetical protein WP4W18E05_P11100 [Klebsiella sp. WP4-W18-ESBL-05]STX01555.1 Uncharacterised protein [Kluyvera ascorbata]